MNVYRPLPLDGYELCHPLRDADFDTIDRLIDGEPRQTAWKPIKMKILREDEGRGLLESDSPWLGSHALIFKTTAVSVMGSLLRENGELLPLHCRAAEVVIFNATRVLDALDEAASSVERLDDGRILWVNSFAFCTEAIRNVDIFRCSTLDSREVFVREAFVELWQSAELRGLKFEQVWD
ncbi:MAG: hypothetical protein QNJ30_27840 [Kiloniellales bacterium]|nr:hypothetical protein [Kiloniellales bacterium]